MTVTAYYELSMSGYDLNSLQESIRLVFTAILTGKHYNYPSFIDKLIGVRVTTAGTEVGLGFTRDLFIWVANWFIQKLCPLMLP